MRFANTHPSASHASPYASASLSRKSAGHMTKVTPELPISCRPGWTPGYELIATRIPTLVLPSNAVLSVSLLLFCGRHTDCLCSPAQYHLNGPKFNPVECTDQFP